MTDSTTTPPRVLGADESLYGKAVDVPYLVRIANLRRAPVAFVMARRHRIARAAGASLRAATVWALEALAAAALLRGLWLIWVPLAWIAAAALLAALAMILDGDKG